ncbi:hypothetical protein IWW37_005503 [Coemansia sp. RSA 2050]|nr:hypothetical protein IWW37_005503 [Coemansia sp. RSA 2050]KAJ2729820.1 hypothetical protein IW152_005479 [Coemansia sp. BCRC 34962]
MPSSSEQDADMEAISSVVASFLHYKTYALNNAVYRRLKCIDELSEPHRQMVASLGTIDKIKRAEALIRENYKLMLDIVYSSSAGSMPDPADDAGVFKEWLKRFFEIRQGAGKNVVSESHMKKLYGTMKLFVRDWSSEGAEERRLTYGPLIEALEDEYSGIALELRGEVHVLVPGAGLGRLAYDICCRGFSTQGNEFSYFMLFASNYILNSSLEKNEHVVYPYIHQFSHVACSEDQMRAVYIPDAPPSNMPYSATAEFSMTAGDFIEVYGADDEKEKWDAIVTCFFMDTARNVLAYLDTIWHALKPGAVWINLGPLLWHFDNVAGESSIELTRDEFLQLVANMGFVLDEKRFKEDIILTYTADSKSMLQYTYHAFMCVARKPK